MSNCSLCSRDNPSTNLDIVCEVCRALRDSQEKTADAGAAALDRAMDTISSRVMPANAVFTAAFTVLPAVLDFLTPQGAYLQWFACSLIVVFAAYVCGVTSLVSRLAPKSIRGRLSAINTVLENPHAFKWVFLSALLVVAFAGVSASKRDEGGVLASASDTVRQYQTSLGVIEDNTTAIMAQNREIAKVTADTKTLLDSDVIPAQKAAVAVGRAIVANTDKVLDETRDLNAAVANNNNVLGRIDGKVDKLKQETSDDPRKELANRGLTWSAQGFGDALMTADVNSIALYLEGGWNPTSAFESGNALGHFIWRGDSSNPVKVEKIVALLASRGLSMSDKIIRFRGHKPMEIAGAATLSCNPAVLSAALRHGADPLQALAALKERGSISPPRDGVTPEQCERNIKQIGSLLGVTFYCHREVGKIMMDDSFFCDLDGSKPPVYRTSWDAQNRMVIHPVNQ